jgi:hypothetical protein
MKTIKSWLVALFLFQFSILLLQGCERLVNPFTGEWKAGILTLEFKADKAFKLIVGDTISVNLRGKYSYDKDTLVLNIDGGGAVNFSYEFNKEKNELLLTPQAEFEYIKTAVRFRRE